jgi:hypothetical protein
MTSRNVIGSVDPAEREKILSAAGGILEDMSVITNAIHQLVTILNEASEAPEIEPLSSEDA